MTTPCPATCAQALPAGTPVIDADDRIGLRFIVLGSLALLGGLLFRTIGAFQHGTHITVAHAMGTTIGINTMILFASVFYIIDDLAGSRLRAEHAMPLRIGFLLTNASLLVFWLALIAAGLGKANYSGASFQEMMMIIRPYLLIFAGSGVGVMLGLWIVAGVGIRMIFAIGYPRGRTVPDPVRAPT